MIFLIPSGMIRTTAEEAVMAFDCAETQDVDVKLIDAATGATIATRRFFHCTGGRWNVSYAVQRTLNYRPAATKDPIVIEKCYDRYKAVKLEIDGACSAEVVMMDSSNVVAPFLSAMPTLRLVADNGYDEVTVMPSVRCVKVILSTEESSEEWRRDLPERDVPLVLRLDFGKMGKIGRAECQLFDTTGKMVGNLFFIPVAAPEQSLNVAWRSALGSVEHYAFPVCLLEQEVHGERTEEERRAFRRAKRGWRAVVKSAYEPVNVRRALAELGAARQCWIIDREGAYHPVEVAAGEHLLAKQGDLKALEFTLEVNGEEVPAWY